MHANNNKGIARFPDGHSSDEPPLYEAIHNKQPDRAPGPGHSPGNSPISAGAASTSQYPISRPLQSKPSRHLKSVTPSAVTCQQVQQTILELILALIFNESPSLKVLDSCVNTCQTYRVDFAAILQQKFIRDHCPIYWAILNGQDSLTRSFLVHAAPITQSTRSEIYHACLAISDQNLFHSLRCWRGELGNKATPLSRILDIDKIVLGVTPSDEVSVTEIPGEGAFVAKMQINLWQQRMRIAGRVFVEFIALGRIWCLAFDTPSPGVVGKWTASLHLQEHSPPTFVNARLVIDLPPLSSNSSQTTDLISLSLPPDNSTSPSPRNLTIQSVTESKVGRTMVLHLQTPHRLAYHNVYTTGQWKDDDGYTCTRLIVLPLDQGASAELSYDNTPFLARDGTLYARLEARLGSAKKPESSSTGTNFEPCYILHPSHNARIATSLSSDASFVLARAWLQQCLHRHRPCSEAATSARTSTWPSRLIGVGDGVVARPRLVLTRDLDTSELEYLTLSHCWGGAKILRLLLENVDKLTVEIPLEELPKTFQDAVIITRRLGYRYIWVDSLCIIQDSPQDWYDCSSVMGEIYAKSICTVAALTARNSDEGCFFDEARNPLFFRPCRISDSWCVEGNPNVGVDLRVGLSALPLHTRAWVVQERILAPRTLYYGSNGLAWECVECSATEEIPWGQVSRFSPKASFFGIPQQTQDVLYDCWTDIQIAYTRCQLTRFSDRLVTISGVVKRIEKLTGWRNEWGLWREHFLRELLWFVEQPTRGRPATEQYLAPTWSWAGIEGRVMMAMGSAEKRVWMAQVVDVGSVEGRGHVQLKGMMKGVWLTKEERLCPRTEGITSRWEKVDWDADVEPSGGDVGKDLQCLLIARLAEYLGENQRFDIGLVLSPQGDEWVRLGVFRQLREGSVSLFPESPVGLREVVVI